MSKKICYYHSVDLDGHASGAIIKNIFPDCQMVGIDYNNKFNFEEVTSDDIVYMVDFSLPPDQMQQLYDIVGENLFWIDHHRSAIIDAKKNGLSKINGIRKENQAGCELTWRYMHNSVLPRAIFLLGRYDVWDHEIDKDILPFQYGMSIQKTKPGEDIWEKLLVKKDLHLVENILQDGRAISKYVYQTNERVAKSMAFPLKFSGLRFLAICRSHTNSKIFDSVYDPQQYDGMMIFCRGGDRWKISLYGGNADNDIDLSIIAKQYDGGGHKNACGFFVDNEIMIQILEGKV